MCDNKECSVHARVDSERIESEYGMDFITKVDYFKEWAVYTDDNVFAPILMVMGRKPVPHMTLLVKVGKEGTLADVEEPGAVLADAVYDGYLSENIEQAKLRHSMILEGVKNGLLNPAEKITPMALLNSL